MEGLNAGDRGTRRRRWILAALMAAAVLAGGLGWAYRERVEKYERDFIGMREDRVIILLGKP